MNPMQPTRLPYTTKLSAPTVLNSQQNTQGEKSKMLIGLGIAVITVSLVNMFLLAVLTMFTPGTMAFIANVLFLLMGMHAVYAGCKVKSREQTIVTVMIMAIVALVIAIPMSMIGFFLTGITNAQHFPSPTLIGIAAFFLLATSILAIGIVSITSHKVCRCCQGYRHDVQTITVGENDHSV